MATAMLERRIAVDDLARKCEAAGWEDGYRTYYTGPLSAEAQLFRFVSGRYGGRVPVALITVSELRDRPLVTLDERLTERERWILATALGTDGEVEWAEGRV